MPHRRWVLAAQFLLELTVGSNQQCACPQHKGSGAQLSLRMHA